MPDELTNADLDCVGEANTRLQELLKESCELPLGKVADLATDHGIKVLELLSRAEASATCFVDYQTGHVRCTSTEEAQA